VEVILPERLAITSKKPSDLDLVFDANLMPEGALICHIWCASKEWFSHWVSNFEGQMILPDSTYELTQGLDDGSRVWAFTMRTVGHEVNPDAGFLFRLFGPIKWGEGA